MNLSEKDLTAIADLLNYEQLSYKMCRMYRDNLTDPEVQKLLGSVATRHKRRFETLLSLIQG